MIERLIAEIFQKTGHKWKVKGKGPVVPTDNDIEKALDEAARVLYNEVPGERLEVGGLIIEKRNTGHDVYVYVGNYL